MSLLALPPAGNRIVFGQSGEPPVFSGYRATWVQSGTAALALALQISKMRAPHIEMPEVLLPGYACPDLIAAAVFAKLRPVLVDIGADDPGYDLTALESALSPNTVAVVAVNFLGLRERLSALRALLSSQPQVTLIEDNAQWFPETTGDTDDITTGAVDLSGDMVCLSFGRGKPVSILGGGCMLLRSDWSIPTDVQIKAAEIPAQSFAIKLRLYNALLHPLFYGLVTRLPGLQLGRTVYKPLQEIHALHDCRLSLVGENIRCYRQVSQAPANILTQSVPAALNLPARLSERAGRLLRFPLLFADKRQRDIAWSRLSGTGLGATAMYQRALTDIEGVSPYINANTPLPGARQFAERLLTLPVHAGVDEKSLQKMLAVIRAVV